MFYPKVFDTNFLPSISIQFIAQFVPERAAAVADMAVLTLNVSDPQSCIQQMQNSSLREVRLKSDSKEYV